MGGHAVSPNLDFSDPIDEALPLDMSKASCRFPDPPSMPVRVTLALPSGAAKDSDLLCTAERPGCRRSDSAFHLRWMYRRRMTDARLPETEILFLQFCHSLCSISLRMLFADEVAVPEGMQFRRNLKADAPVSHSLTARESRRRSNTLICGMGQALRTLYDVSGSKRSARVHAHLADILPLVAARASMRCVCIALAAQPDNDPLKPAS